MRVGAGQKHGVGKADSWKHLCAIQGMFHYAMKQCQGSLSECQTTMASHERLSEGYKDTSEHPRAGQ